MEITKTWIEESKAIEEVIETLTKIPRKMDGVTYKIFEAKVACDMAIKAIRFQQSVVRCKDCALKPYGNRCEHWSSDVSWFGKYVEDDDYCSQGIRRDEE